MTAVAAYTPDLMDRSKIAAAVPGVRFVASPDALAGLGDGVEVVVVDLAKRGVVDALPAIVASATKVVAYGSHVDTATLAAARQAGVTTVLPRSKFFGDIDAALRD